MQRYVVISSDCHAGPNPPVYREYLDAGYREDFDVELAERQSLIDERRAAMGMDPFTGDDDFKAEWFGADEEGNSLHEIGMRGAWDASRRDTELDRDGVTGEVVFPGPDAATGKMGAPFGAGFNPVATRGPGPPPRRRPCLQPLGRGAVPGQPRAAGGLIVAPILGDLDGAISEIRRAHDDGFARRHHHPARSGDSYESYTSYSL